MVPSRKVLVVDDEDVLRTSLGTILERNGYAVVLAPNVPEALAALAAEHFDVLLSDHRMPGPGDGMTVVRAMRETQPKAVTLLMSATFADADATPLLVDEFLPKPVRLQDVVNIIRARLKPAN